jgi:hypothetical protein
VYSKETVFIFFKTQVDHLFYSNSVVSIYPIFFVSLATKNFDLVGVAHCGKTAGRIVLQVRMPPILQIMGWYEVGSKGGREQGSVEA